MALLPEDPAARKAIPLHGGVLAYFPAALAEVAKRSKQGNDTHSPGQPLRWDRSKSADHLDCLTRHLLEGDLVGVAWRALAALQLKCEADGSPVAPGAKGSRLDYEAKQVAALNEAFERERAAILERYRKQEVERADRSRGYPYSYFDSVTAEWQDSHGAPVNPVNQRTGD